VLKYPRTEGAEESWEGRRIDDRVDGEVDGRRTVRIRRDGKTPLEAALAFPKVELSHVMRAREEGKKESEGEKEGARRGKTDGGRRTYPGGWRRRKEKLEEKEEVEMEGRREIKMAAPASGVDPPTLPPRGNKRKKGRKLRSSAEGGRSACRGATNEATNRASGGMGRE